MAPLRLITHHCPLHNVVPVYASQHMKQLFKGPNIHSGLIPKLSHGQVMDFKVTELMGMKTLT